MPGDLLFDEKNWKTGATDKIWSKYWGSQASPLHVGDGDRPGNAGNGLKTPEGHLCPSSPS